ncbi:MAG: hypothetical protein GY853_09285 [PVC group bacterium]|nr:hypothetical protein [PVC group bacterium]
MKIKFLVIFCLCFFVFCSLIQAKSDWAEIKGDHFIVYYKSGEYKNFAREVSRKAEKYYNSIADDLGYVRYSGFWKWDDRVKIYIHSDHDSYVEDSGRPSWSRGMADYNRKEIISYAWSEGFVDQLLPHELAHLIFRDFVGFKGEVPLWLDEGVAQWEEHQQRQERKLMIKQLAQNGRLIPLEDMMRMDIRQVSQGQKVKLRFLGGKNVQIVDGSDLVAAYYLQAFSLVGFLVERYYAEDFVIFCRQLRDGASIARALSHTYPTKMSTLADFEEKWVKYILK